jgi:hypothetical protein
MPLVKVPIHLSYLLYLGQYSRRLATAYFRSAMALCDRTGVEPSLLLHPLDFLGGDDDGDLAFFPAMRSPAAEKLRLAGEVLDIFRDGRNVVTMREHARKYRAASPVGAREQGSDAPQHAASYGDAQPAAAAAVGELP